MDTNVEESGRQEPLGEWYHQPDCWKIGPEEKDIRPDLIYQEQAIVLLGYLNWEFEVKAGVYYKY